MSVNLDGIRRDAAKRARQKKKGGRIVPDFNDCPSEWCPRSVVNPDTGQPFSWDEAWNFLAGALENGHDMTHVKLREPFGNNDNAYVVVVPLASERVYIKFQLGSWQIIGRSFHYSKYSD